MLNTEGSGSGNSARNHESNQTLVEKDLPPLPRKETASGKALEVKDLRRRFRTIDLKQKGRASDIFEAGDSRSQESCDSSDSNLPQPMLDKLHIYQQLREQQTQSVKENAFTIKAMKVRLIYAINNEALYGDKEAKISRVCNFTKLADLSQFVQVLAEERAQLLAQREDHWLEDIRQKKRFMMMQQLLAHVQLLDPKVDLKAPRSLFSFFKVPEKYIFSYKSKCKKYWDVFILFLAVEQSFSIPG